MSEERLQKILAAAGLGSRRSCEQIILDGRVTVDGRVVSELGAKADPAQQEIRVDGKPLAGQQFRYIMLHKPNGYLSVVDPRATYPSWEELVRVPERLFAVGRLDHDSEGLLLLTNDGALTNYLAHPRYGHARTYLVQVEGVPDARKLRRWQHGVMLDDGPTAPAQVQLLRRPPQPFDWAARPATGRPTSWLQFIIREGRKRQVRRMVSLLGHPALRVIRTDLGPLHLGDLRPGKWRDLTPGEVKALREEARQNALRSQSAARPLRAGHVPAGAAPARTAQERKHALLPCTIAIDGPAASGKSTIGGKLAQDIDYLYFDTGVMYRALTWVALDRRVPIEDEAAVSALAEGVELDVQPPTVNDGRDVTVLADGEDITWQIRRPEVDRAVSPVSAYPRVREVMRDQQRRIASGGRVVMVGRDIGTVVLPEAELKIYLDASLPVRAHRRYLERVARGESADEQKVLAELRRRDQIDSSREHAPLAAAKDAIVLDSTALDILEVMDRVSALIERWRRGLPAGRAAAVCGDDR